MNINMSPLGVTIIDSNLLMQFMTPDGGVVLQVRDEPAGNFPSQFSVPTASILRGIRP